MKSAISLSAFPKKEQIIRFTLSVPVQSTLYTSLCALTVWTLFFSTYPPTHNALHQLRHSTLLVGCH